MKQLFKSIFIFLIVFLFIIFLSWHFVLFSSLTVYLTNHSIISEEFETNFYLASEMIELQEGYIDPNPNLISWQGFMPYLNFDILPIGELVIPAIDLQLSILYFPLPEHMYLGAATMPFDQNQRQPMGVGNYVLTSHPEFHSRTLFGDLYLLEEGDFIYLRDEMNVYIYETILSSEFIEPDRIDIVDEVPGMTLITLFTTAPDGWQRIMVRGELVDQFSISESTIEIADSNDEVSYVIYRLTEGRPSIPFPLLEIVGTILVAISAATGVLWTINKIDPRKKSGAEKLNL